MNPPDEWKKAIGVRLQQLGELSIKRALLANQVAELDEQIKRVTDELTSLDRTAGLAAEVADGARIKSSK